jgi:hypothetical protein
LAIIACTLVQHGAERVDVGPRVELPVTGRLLGAHVLRSTERDSGLREAVAPGLLHRERDPEVGQYRLAFHDQDVLRLDVPVHDALAVRVVEGGRDLPCDRERLPDAELLLALEQIPQRLALHVRHDVEEELTRPAAVVQRQDVGMLEIGGQGDFREEPLGSDDRRQLGSENLHRHLPLVLQVVGEVDGGHPAHPEHALDAVAVGQGCREPGEDLGHDGLR